MGIPELTEPLEQLPEPEVEDYQQEDQLLLMENHQEEEEENQTLSTTTTVRSNQLRRTDLPPVLDTEEEVEEGKNRTELTAEEMMETSPTIQKMMKDGNMDVLHLTTRRPTLIQKMMTQVSPPSVEMKKIGEIPDEPVEDFQEEEEVESVDQKITSTTPIIPSQKQFLHQLKEEEGPEEEKDRMPLKVGTDVDDHSAIQQFPETQDTQEEAQEVQVQEAQAQEDLNPLPIVDQVVSEQKNNNISVIFQFKTYNTYQQHHQNNHQNNLTKDNNNNSTTTTGKTTPGARVLLIDVGPQSTGVDQFPETGEVQLQSFQSHQGENVTGTEMEIEATRRRKDTDIDQKKKKKVPPSDPAGVLVQDNNLTNLSSLSVAAKSVLEAAVATYCSIR